MRTPDRRLFSLPDDMVAAVEAVYDEALLDLPVIGPDMWDVIEQAFHSGLVAASVIGALQALGRQPCVCPACRGLGTPDGLDECDRCGGHGLAHPGDPAAQPFLSAAERIDRVLPATPLAA